MPSRRLYLACVRAIAMCRVCQSESRETRRDGQPGRAAHSTGKNRTRLAVSLYLYNQITETLHDGRLHGSLARRMSEGRSARRRLAPSPRRRIPIHQSPVKCAIPCRRSPAPPAAHEAKSRGEDFSGTACYFTDTHHDPTIPSRTCACGQHAHASASLAGHTHIRGRRTWAPPLLLPYGRRCAQRGRSRARRYHCLRLC